jgi:hypothetical protein
MPKHPTAVGVVMATLTALDAGPQPRSAGAAAQGALMLGLVFGALTAAVLLLRRRYSTLRRAQ